MPLSTQIHTLRVLELREVTPLSTNEVRPVDIRIVAAAKVDLADPEQRKAFREDLYYRLNVISLTIPPLRERRDDIPLLFSYFAERAVLGMLPSATMPSSPVTAQSGSLPEWLKRREAEIIRETLSIHGGNVQETIATLGIPRTTFYDKLQRHSIVRRDFKGET